MWDSRLVILDEPTAALGVAQTRQVLDLVKRLAERDLGVVIVTHNLHDVFEVADRITVLRLGQRVALLERAKTTQQEVVQAITAGTLNQVPGMREEERTRGMSDRPVDDPTVDPTAARVEPVAADALADDVSARELRRLSAPLVAGDPSRRAGVAAHHRRARRHRHRLRHPRRHVF